MPAESGWVDWRLLAAAFLGGLAAAAPLYLVLGRRAESAARRLQEEYTAARAMAERLRMIVETAHDAFVGMDSNGRITDWNPAAEATFGWKREEVLGRLLGEIIVPEALRQAHAAGFTRYLSTGQASVLGKRLELPGLHRDGRELPLELTIAPLELGEERLFFAFLRDITERRRVDRLQSEFISTVSHELRTPLTSIRGSLGLVAGGVAGELSPQARPLVDIALKNSERLVRLINDILDIEKISSGKMIFDVRPVELMPLVAHSIEANRAFASQLGVRLVLDASVPGSLVAADPDRLLQVLTNLLSNAAKFSPSDGVVSVRVDRQEARLRVSIADRGAGIPEEFRSRIFQRFAQADGSDARTKSGTGLGLSISKAIVERLGGTIGFATEAGRGTTFYFDLPEVASDRPLEAQGNADATPRKWGPRILTCEDDLDTATVLKQMLEASGFSVDLAHSAAAARDCLSRNDYDLMTLDLNLPDADGVALLRELRDSEATRDLPIVVVSARADEGQAQLSAEAFMLMDWLPKPIDHPKLVAAVHRFVRKSAGERSHVLHVEDDAEIAEVVSRMLGPECEVANARTLAEAQKLLAEKRFDLILLDQELPDGHGMDLVPRVRALTRRPVPIVVFSAYEMSREVAGRVAAALVKSKTSNDELLGIIRSLLGREETAGPAPEGGEGVS